MAPIPRIKPPTPTDKTCEKIPRNPVYTKGEPKYPNQTLELPHHANPDIQPTNTSYSFGIPATKFAY